MLIGDTWKCWNVIQSAVFECRKRQCQQQQRLENSSTDRPSEQPLPMLAIRNWVCGCGMCCRFEWVTPRQKRPRRCQQRVAWRDLLTCKHTHSIGVRLFIPARNFSYLALTRIKKNSSANIVCCLLLLCLQIYNPKVFYMVPSYRFVTRC